MWLFQQYIKQLEHVVCYLLLTSFIELSPERGFSEKYCPHQQINVT